MKHTAFYQTTIGLIGITDNDGVITKIFLADEQPPENGNEQATPLQKKAARQLEEYLVGQRQIFDFKFTAAGTDFQKSVWEALRKVPYGETRSYKQVAEMIGRPNAARAVGMANHNNPIMIIIPCHRVIGADGRLTGYAGGLEVKQKLLELEKRHLYAGAVAPGQDVQLG